MESINIMSEHDYLEGGVVIQPAESPRKFVIAKNPASLSDDRIVGTADELYIGGHKVDLSRDNNFQMPSIEIDGPVDVYFKGDGNERNRDIVEIEL